MTTYANPVSGFQIHENKIEEQRVNHKKKKVKYLLGSPEYNKVYSTNSEFQIPESDNNLHTTALKERNPVKLKKDIQINGRQHPNASDLNRNEIVDMYYVDPKGDFPKDELKKRKNYAHNKNITNGHSNLENDIGEPWSIKGTTGNIHPSRSFLHEELKIKRNKNVINDSGILNNNLEIPIIDKKMSKQDIYNEIQKNYNNDYNNNYNNYDNSYDIKKNSSLICKTINYNGEPVKINNDIVKNKLILSCYPKHNHNPKVHFRNPSYKNEISSYYGYPPAANDLNLNTSTDIQYYNKVLPDQSFSTHEQTNNFQTNNEEELLVEGERVKDKETNYKQLVEQNKQILNDHESRYLQCKKYNRQFTSHLWCLFIINLLLILVGLILLLITLSHILFRNYINTVINNAGFATWVWLAMILSLLIIIVGAYGVVTAVIRARMMFIVYIIIATITAALIVVFLLILWFVMSNLKLKKQESMKKTLSMYRCHLWVQSGWDDLQRNHQCCGISNYNDWRYIPPSCCQAHTKFEKLACVGHSISTDRAHKGGCGPPLEDYFVSLFFLITCLLILALILLVLGILNALRLTNIYKFILYCKDYYTTNI